LEDKSSHVRRNVIKLLSKLISTHPFALLHGGQLSYADWLERLTAVVAQIDGLQPPSNTPGISDYGTTVQGEADGVDERNDRDAKPQGVNPAEQETGPGAADSATGEDLMKLQLTKRYYTEALKFTESLHGASEVISQLLASKNKSEVLESMDFFVIADAYKLATAKVYSFLVVRTR
jgi:condensin complex subunit 1